MKAWRHLPGCVRPAAGSSSSSTARPSTAPTQGNIGPVADALIAALGCGFALACPAFPANARSVYQGHLFVGGALLNESGMEHHPLTPMTDANLVRVLSRQTDGTVGLVPYATVEQGRDGDPLGDDGAEGTGPPLCDRRCGQRYASGRDRRGSRAPRADHRRFWRRDGAAGQLPSTRSAAGARDAAALPDAGGPRRGDCRLVFARHARRSLAWRESMCRCCSSIRWRTPETRAHGRARRASGWLTNSAPRRS